jgi:hypothetical protein
MGDEGPAVQSMMLMLLVVVPIVLVLGFAFLAAVLWEWISILRERRAVRECLRLHGSPPKGKIDELL